MPGVLSKPERVRAFVAIELPPEKKATLSVIGDAFKSSSDVLRWVAPNLLHITLRFLGPLDAARVESACAATAAVASKTPAFVLALAGLGGFPNERTPRVVWAGLARDAGWDALGRLFASLEVALEAYGFEAESKRFSPHVTLARVRDDIDMAKRRLAAETLLRARQEFDVSGSFQVTGLTLMRSTLKPAGPVYTPVAKMRLQED